MTVMIIGLLLFLGTHSVRIFAEDWRNTQIAQRGEGAWKGIYSLLSIIGLVLIVWGYGEARMDPAVVWQPPVWTKHVAALLLIPSFILLVAAYVPGTKLKKMVGHPMVLGVKLWAFAHLFANGMLADIILFGSFLLWAILDYRAARRRDKASGVRYEPKGVSRDIIAVVIGLVIYGAFAGALHNVLIGVKPFGA